MKNVNASGSSRNLSPQPKPDTSSVSEMLTPSEIERLRQDKKETSAYMQKEFRRILKK